MNTYYERYWAEGQATWSASDGTILPIEERLLAPHLVPGATVLDYGCGDGQRYGKILAARGVQYRGFDVSREAVERAVASGLDVACLAEGARTTLADGSCDLALCFEVLEHLMEPDEAVREIVRVLKSTGVAVFSVPNPAAWYQRLEFLATGFWNPGGSPLTSRKTPWRDPHIRFFSPKLLRRMLLANGFADVRICGSDFDLRNMPYLYRSKSLGGLAHRASQPVRWLGAWFPSLFSVRTFAVARK